MDDKLNVMPADLPVHQNRFVPGNVSSVDDVDIDYVVVPLSSLRLEFVGGDKTTFKTRAQENKALRLILKDGRVMTVSDQMFETFAKLYGLSRTVFDYWSGDDVFKAVGVKNNGGVRLCFERKQKQETGIHGQVLSFTNPKRAILSKERAVELIQEHGGTEVTYQQGILSASFDCPFPMEFDVTGRSDSKFSTRFMLDFPLHGFGLPASYLQILRQVCTNGAVARHRAFRTEFSLGKEDQDIGLVLDRALASYNNEEGYHALKARMIAASRSWASLHELVKLSEALVTSMQEEKWGLTQKQTVLRKLSDISGDPMTLWSISNLKDISTRYMKLLPIRATVYELINFASEISTHNFSTLRSRNRIAGWLGDLFTAEYDLENTCEQFPEFRDIYCETNIESATQNARSLNL